MLGTSSCQESTHDSAECKTIPKRLRVLELYAGIGGMHYALQGCKVDFEVVQAMEINPLVLCTYRHNFPHTNAKPKNIDNLTADEINRMNIDLIVMSPPCQPFCRVGNKRGLDDTRSSSLAKLLQILPGVSFTHLLLENVQGFEKSEAREAVVETLTRCEMKYQEFLLNPRSFNVPNSRPRYYLIAKKSKLKWNFEAASDIHSQLPCLQTSCEKNFQSIKRDQEDRWSWLRNRNGVAKKKRLEDEQLVVQDVIDYESDLAQYAVPDKLVKKYGPCMDLVSLDSKTTNCFTKGYGTYVKGTGSYIIIPPKSSESDGGSNISASGIITQNYRYFTPREIARLMCYPEEFTFPAAITTKQRYKALGNSINVFVVSILLSLLLTE